MPGLPTRIAFDWDQANREHIARHGVTPTEAAQVISGLRCQSKPRTGAERNGTPSSARPPPGGYSWWCGLGDGGGFEW
jgi:hypothetical protein